MKNYHPEPYWSDVARRIEARQGNNVIAGDDEPYYRYKRAQFLKLLHSVDFSNKNILEIGSGPGGNLKEIWEKHKVKSLSAVDISEEMITLAQQHLPTPIQIQKINGTQLPFKNREKDIVFSATVLQHNTDDNMMATLLGEMARVSKDKIYLFERIEQTTKGDDLCVGRPISTYTEILKPLGFQLKESQFINIKISYIISGTIRKLFNPSSRKEGEAMTALATFLQKTSLPITRKLDKIFTSKTDVAKLTFERIIP